MLSAAWRRLSSACRTSSVTFWRVASSVARRLSRLAFASPTCAVVSPPLKIERLTKPPKFQVSWSRSEEHTSELQSLTNLVCRLLLEKKKNKNKTKDQH